MNIVNTNKDISSIDLTLCDGLCKISDNPGNSKWWIISKK